MKRIITILLFLSFISIIGCETINKSKASSYEKVENKTFSTDKDLIKFSSNKEQSIIENAQKEYQDSYNEYVRCLRESGPQTVETLQALSIYQQKYHIYQMLLKAQSNNQ